MKIPESYREANIGSNGTGQYFVEWFIGAVMIVYGKNYPITKEKLLQLDVIFNKYRRKAPYNSECSDYSDYIRSRDIFVQILRDHADYKPTIKIGGELV